MGDPLPGDVPQFLTSQELRTTRGKPPRVVFCSGLADDES